MTSIPWWKGAVIYQIYPRSFYDSNGDGVGDLRGIFEKLDYIASLNVDAIWISPFFTSPMKDFGYDISDYRNVDPLFGTLDDFKSLLSKAHQFDLKVIVDQVISHSSDQHPWFIESKANETNSKSDWYVWANPKPDGARPNNWLSFFGGPAWTWCESRQQYYLHNFLSSQPDINFYCDEARQAQLDNIEFWLALGVDGVRLDVVNFYYHDNRLRDNPDVQNEYEEKVGVTNTNPYSKQQHLFDITQPENIAFLRSLRSLLDKYPGATTIGEINAEDDLQVMADYTSGNDKLHMAYTFDLLGKNASPDYIKSVVDRFEARVSDGWACWALGNHDVERIASRWGNDTDTALFCRVVAALLLCLRGSVCIYQGDELGLPEAILEYEDLVDPYGKQFWPEYRGRDGCRTPMPWSNESQGGFTTSTPWLPVSDVHRAMAVSIQTADETSTLNFFRDFLIWRKRYPELLRGEITHLNADKHALSFVRRLDRSELYLAFNLSDTTTKFSSDVALEPINVPGFTHGYTRREIELPPYQAFFSRVVRNGV